MIGYADIYIKRNEKWAMLLRQMSSTRERLINTEPVSTSAAILAQAKEPKMKELTRVFNWS